MNITLRDIEIVVNKVFDGEVKKPSRVATHVDNRMAFIALAMEYMPLIRYAHIYKFLDGVIGESSVRYCMLRYRRYLEVYEGKKTHFNDRYNLCRSVLDAVGKERDIRTKEICMELESELLA